MCHCNPSTPLAGSSVLTSGHGSHEDPVIVDRTESLEYYTPPVASPPVTTPPPENSIPLPVQINLGVTPPMGGEEENHPPCCCVPPPAVAALVPITLEDEVISPLDVDCAIVHAQYAGQAPMLTDHSRGMRHSVGNGGAHHNSTNRLPAQTAIRGRRQAILQRL